MPTVCLKFRFNENTKVKTLMDACASIQRQAVEFALNNNKTATFTIIKALYPSLKTQYPNLHSQWLQSSVRSGAAVVHSFKNRKRKRKRQGIKIEKVKNFWNHVALELIAWAMANGAAIVLEDLKGIKGMIAKNVNSRRMRQRLLNFWSVMTLHKILVQKAGFYGVPLVFVEAKNTSRTCPVCGRINEGLRGHVFECSCGLKKGRHEVAVINIAYRGMEILGVALPRQGLVGDPCCLFSDFGLKAQDHDRNTQANV